MNFREMAIQVYHEAEQEQEAWRSDQSAGFAKRAARMFGRSIVEADVNATPIEPRLALLAIEDIEIEAREKHGGIEFFVVTVCADCGENIAVHTPTLADIGKALENGPPACKNCDI